MSLILPTSQQLIVVKPYQVPVLIGTNLPADKVLTVRVLGRSFYTAEFEGQCRNGVLEVPIESVADRALDYIASDWQTGDLYMALNTTLTDAAPNLQFQSATGGSVGGGAGLIAHIAGTVQVDGTAAERSVIVISDDPAGRQVLGEGTSAPDGTFDISYNEWGGAVIALALDNYGGDWTAETTLNAGTIIHPTTPNGYVYEVTTSGTTGTTEPNWSTSGAVNDGSVAFSPRPFYRPIASGPLQGEITQTEPEPETTYIEMRIQILDQADANEYNELDEFEFLDASGTPIDISGAGYIASHQHTSFPASNAFDSDTNSHWNSGQGVPTPWIGVQFATAVAVKQIRLTPNTIGRAPSEFRIEYSTDTPGTWTAAAAHTATWLDATPQTFNVEAP